MRAWEVREVGELILNLRWIRLLGELFFLCLAEITAIAGKSRLGGIPIHFAQAFSVTKKKSCY